MSETSGGRANKHGAQLEKRVEDVLVAQQYKYVKSKDFFAAQGKVYSKHVEVCESIYSTPEKKHVIYADFMVRTPSGCLAIECKSQTSPGSVDEKYPYLNENIKTKYQRDTIIVLDTPAAKIGASIWLKAQELCNPNLKFVFKTFIEFRSWAINNL